MNKIPIPPRKRSPGEIAQAKRLADYEEKLMIVCIYLGLDYQEYVRDDTEHMVKMVEAYYRHMVAKEKTHA